MKLIQITIDIFLKMLLVSQYQGDGGDWQAMASLPAARGKHRFWGANQVLLGQ